MFLIEFQRKRGKDKIKRKPRIKKSLQERRLERDDRRQVLDTAKTGQKYLSTGANISREARSWYKLSRMFM